VPEALHEVGHHGAIESAEPLTMKAPVFHRWEQVHAEGISVKAAMESLCVVPDPDPDPDPTVECVKLLYLGGDTWIPTFSSGEQPEWYDGEQLIEAIVADKSIVLVPGVEVEVCRGETVLLRPVAIPA
jgi:hypothetical protein